MAQQVQYQDSKGQLITPVINPDLNLTPAGQITPPTNTPTVALANIIQGNLGQTLTPVSPVANQATSDIQPGSVAAEHPPIVYPIKAGDSLSAIAQEYGTTVQALMAANPNIKDPNLIIAGQKLNIPNSSSGQGVQSAGGNDVNSSGTSTEQIANNTAPDNPQNQSPSDFIATYKKALADLGIPDIKSEFDNAVKKQTDLINEMNKKITDIQDDPWMTQGVKERNIQKIKNSYQTQLETLTNQQKLYDSMYKEGIAQAQFLTTGEVRYQQDIIDAAQKAVEAQAKLDNAKIDTQVVDIGGKKLLINTQTGEMIKDLGKSGSTSSSGSGTKTDAQKVSAINNLINSSKGADGKIAWETYAKAAQQWIALGGTTSDFKTAFPPETLMDQGNISALPSSLKPSGSSSIYGAFNLLPAPVQ